MNENVSPGRVNRHRFIINHVMTYHCVIFHFGNVAHHSLPEYRSKQSNTYCRPCNRGYSSIMVILQFMKSKVNDIIIDSHTILSQMGLKEFMHTTSRDKVAKLVFGYVF